MDTMFMTISVYAITNKKRSWGFDKLVIT